VRNLLDRARPWLAVAGAALMLAALLPTAAGYARRYAFVQAVQFVVFAAASPALLVLGWRGLPGRRGQAAWHRLPAWHRPAGTAGRPRTATRPADRAAAAGVPHGGDLLAAARRAGRAGRGRLRDLARARRDAGLPAAAAPPAARGDGRGRDVDHLDHLTWLSAREDPDEELGQLVAAWSPAVPGPGRPPRPTRGRPGALGTRDRVLRRNGAWQPFPGDLSWKSGEPGSLVGALSAVIRTSPGAR
jgi:hypothetical protein